MAGIVNPHTSMVYHDPNSKDHNTYEIMNNLREKQQTIEKYLALWKGQILQTVNVKSGEVRSMEFRLDPMGKPTRRARTMTVHLLFGDWRIATAEDVERQAKKDKIEGDRLARIEANRAAEKAGLMFESLAKASDTINRFNQAKKDEAAATVAVEDEKRDEAKKKKAS